NGEAVRGTKPLSPTESASVPATASGSKRFLFLLPEFKKEGVYDDDMLPAMDMTVTLKGIGKPAGVRLLGDRTRLNFEQADKVVTVRVPAAKRTRLVDVLEIDLK